MGKKIVFTDIDNTLYDWPDFFAPSFRAMVYVLVRELKLTEEQIYQECKQVFAQRGSLEYAFVIQELESVRNLPTDRVRDLIRAGRGAFLHVQRSRLKAYTGVHETLTWLRDQHFTVVGITNSAMHRAQKRLWELKLDSLLSGLVAWEGFEGESTPATDGYVSSAKHRTLTRLPRSIPISRSDCKPNQAHYEIALDAFSGTPTKAWALGDSLSKDLRPAANLGIKTIWARYGAGLDPDDRDQHTLLRITHWDTKEISQTYSTDGFEPDFTIDSFDEITRIVPATILSLF